MKAVGEACNSVVFGLAGEDWHPGKIIQKEMSKNIFISALINHLQIVPIIPKIINLIPTPFPSAFHPELECHDTQFQEFLVLIAWK
jgi:nucleoside permease NupC